MFSDEEANVYDRQIRLWGVKAQQQIRSADIFLVGLDGLASEVIKNLVLTGINSITMMDEQPVTQFDMLSNLFSRNQIGLKRSEACQKAVHELNPMVKVNVKNETLSNLLENENEAKNFLKTFHAVIIINHDLQSAIHLNDLCHEQNIPFFFACSWGTLSMIYLDLGENFNDKTFVPLKNAFEKKNLMLLSTSNSLTKREIKRIMELKKIFLSVLTLFRYYEKNAKFPILLNEADRRSLNEELKIIENNILDELNSTSNENEPAWTTLDDWHSKIFGQLTFISSIVGGFLAQDVIRTVTNDEIDYNLFLFYDIYGQSLNIGF